MQNTNFSCGQKRVKVHTHTLSSTSADAVTHPFTACLVCARFLLCAAARHVKRKLFEWWHSVSFLLRHTLSFLSRVITVHAARSTHKSGVLIHPSSTELSSTCTSSSPSPLRLNVSFLTFCALRGGSAVPHAGLQALTR
jgi:hypothetical protein